MEDEADDIDMMLNIQQEIDEEEEEVTGKLASQTLSSPSSVGGDSQEEEGAVVLQKKGKQKKRKWDISDDSDEETKRTPAAARARCKYVSDEASGSEESSGSEEEEEEARKSDDDFIDDGDDDEGGGDAGPMPFLPSEDEDEDDEDKDDNVDEDNNDEDDEKDKDSADDNVDDEKKGDEGSVEAEDPVAEEEDEAFDEDGEDLAESLENVPDFIYNDPSNLNNMSRSLKVVDMDGVSNSFLNDGYTYCFLSEAEGPMLSSMAKKQILMLLHIINAPIHRKHLAETKTLKPHFSGSEDILEKLIEDVDLGYNPYLSTGTSERDMEGPVGSIPFDKVCDFREGVMEGTNVVRPVDVGEILLSPVTVSYEEESTCTLRRKTYWLVMLRTRLCYDFAGHVRSIMTCDECIVGKMRRIHQPMGSSGFTQYLSWINDLTREVLLYNYKICPNVDSFLKMQGSVNVDPIKRFHEIASPDSVDAVCNIYEIYRAMVHGIGEGARNISVEGFSEGAPFTSSKDEFNYKASIRAQEEWRKQFATEKKRIQEHADEVKKAERIKDSGEREKRIAELQEEDVGDVCLLPSPVGWPVLEEGEGGERVVVTSSLPKLGLVMQVDIMGKFKYDREQSFQSSFGDLPARATFELTSMLYKTTTTTSGSRGLPRSIFMSEPELLSEYDRKQKFLPSENTLDAFYTAGYYGKQYTNVMKVIRNFPVAQTKMNLYNEYMERAQHQFKSLVLNGNLHSSHTQFAAGYIDRVDGIVCSDLRKLVERMFSESDVVVTTSDDMEDQTFAEDHSSKHHWDVMCSSTFVAANWTYEEMRRKHNQRFFCLKPQNLKICNDTALSSIMYRLGQHNGWTYIGMPTVVCDTACKLMARTANNAFFVPETRKKPSAGLDLCREALDSMRTSHVAYLGGASALENVSDDSKITQLKRTTANGIQTGFAMFVNGQLEKAPDNELARDCAMPEGPPDSFEGMCQLLTAIPRDGDNNSELWTTVDKDKTNVRAKAIMKLIVGFSLYLVLMAKNFLFEGKTETRYFDLLIVCNVLCSSFPIDMQGMMRRVNGEKDAFEEAEEGEDRNELRRGIISTSVNQKDKKKGDKPSDEDQKLWAPMNYFCFWTAGINVAMMNKMGSWNMVIDYGFKSVSDYLYHYEISTLSCIISEIDMNNASRYYESYLARCIADTTLKKTFLAMQSSDTVSQAVLDATRSLSYEAIHLSMLPVVHERLLGRLLQFEPLLGMATVGLSLDVPVVPIHSLLQFFDGKQVANVEDYEMISKFYRRCLERNMFLTRTSIMDGNPGGPGSALSAYITSYCESWDGPSSILRERININAGSDKRTPADILSVLSKKVYNANEKVLNASAHCKHSSSFHRCLQSLQRPYDMRGFLGGMSKFSDFRYQMQSVQAPRAHDFPDGILDSSSSAGAGSLPQQQQQQQEGVDPILVVGPRSGDIYCIGIHVPSILLWFSIMGRPRRDNGIVVEAAHSLMTLSLRTLPKSIFPYDVVPMTRLDHITKEQALMDLRVGGERDHQTMVRFKNSSIVSNYFDMECTGMGRSLVLEDEMYMRSIFMISKDIGCSWSQLPAHKWKLTLDMEWDVTYPMVRYEGADGPWKGKTRGFLGNSSRARHHVSVVAFMNPTHRSLTISGVTPESYQEYVDECQEQGDDWMPQCKVIHEFSACSLREVDQSRHTMVRGMDQAVENLFSMGFLPCPLYRRPGVLVVDSIEEANPRIGVIVSHHSRHRHGCEQCKFKKQGCYLCPENPFYEAYFGKGSYSADLDSGEQGTLRLLPVVACETVIPVGTKLWLSIHSVELLSLVDGVSSLTSSGAGSHSKKRRKYRYRTFGGPSSVARNGRDRDRGDEEEEGDNHGGQGYIVAWLDVCRSFSSREGMAYISVKVLQKNNMNAADTRGVYVKPGDLRLPGVDESLARTHIVI